MTEAGAFRGPFDADAWTWWQGGRLRYNIALAVAGWAAYCLALVVVFLLEKPLWKTWRDGLSITLLMGLGYLAAMAAANVCYLLGPGLETVIRPDNREAYRRSAYAMGLWGSVALPFLYPLVLAAALLVDAPGA